MSFSSCSLPADEIEESLTWLNCWLDESDSTSTLLDSMLALLDSVLFVQAASVANAMPRQ